MSVVETNVIDAIGVEVRSGELILTISDHLGWDQELQHIALLQEKLNSYLRFVESRELLETYPDAAGRKVVVDVVSLVEPNLAGIEFLSNARDTMRKVGLELRFRVYRDESN